MDSSFWGTLAAWAGLLLVIIGGVAKMLGRDLARIDAEQKEQTDNIQAQARLTDERIRESILALDVRLQNELRLMIEANHLTLDDVKERMTGLADRLEGMLADVAQNTARMEIVMGRIEGRKPPRR